ncbi:centromere protein O isoform X1 [Osmerus mordax]|uniref:centromere protein O isoform X1 n=1 Tax=Osmerus mordax TaxID=8014 RepID=UPI00350EE913
MLEMQANNHRHNKGAEPLYDQRDRPIEVNRTLKMRDRMDKVSPFDGAIDDDPENTQLLQLMARHSQLKDLLQAHHLIGGYDVTQTRNGKGVCVSLATSYEGVYLETYNLDVDLSASMKICRHNIPPFIPLERLSEQSHLQTDVRAFLDTLSQHLNAYVGRKQQLGIVKKLHKSVEVMESNAPCTVLVLMLTVPEDAPQALLCSLEYGDLTRCLPTHASVEAEDKVLPDSLQLEKYRALLLEFPVHTALQTMLKMGMIL